MGLFSSKKSKERDGERYYRMSLSHNEHELEYLEKSAALGNCHGKAGLARYYLEHFPKDSDRMHRALQLMTEAEAEGVLPDYKQFIKISEAAGNYELSLSMRTKLAEAGDKVEQFKLGYGYESGNNGMSVDLEKSRFWYSKAIEQGHAAACNNMAILLLNGQGGAKDEKGALELMIKAAELGSLPACGNLAWDYYDGSPPCPQDYEMAYHYAVMGTEKGHPKSRYVLALLRAQGLGTERDLASAVSLFEELAKEDYQDSGELLKKYSDVHKDLLNQDFQRRYEEISPLLEKEPEKALELFKKLVSDGYNKARDGVSAAHERIAQLADERFLKAQAENDEAGMRAAAEGRSIKGCLYFLRQARDMAFDAAYNNKVTLSDWELGRLAPYYISCAFFGIRLPEPDMDMILILLSVRGQQLLDSGDRKTAISLMDSVRFFNDPFCQYILAQAYSDGSWAGEDKALEVLEEAILNPKINDEIYKDTLKSMKENIYVYQYNKSIRNTW